ncbi:MAG: winged helix-turn-helix domain-containing protein [Gammaproteobacteria bacterium]|nr:winged helix-turn-helix domain-containing protein [Gammaproteobacteria bacterium]
MELLQRTQPFRIGDWRVDPMLDELSRSGQRVKVEPRIMRLLCFLAERPGEVIPADELLDHVWTGVVVGPGSVYQAVAQLRQLLDDTDLPSRYIVTVPRKGYRLVAEIVRNASAAHTPPPDTAPSTAPAAAAPIRSIAKPRFRLYAMAAAAAAACLVLVTAFLVPRSAPEAPMVPVLAVLPFVDLGNAASGQEFSAGLAEDLRNSLARLPGVHVLGRGSVARLQADDTDARQIGRTLGATHVLEGTVRPNGSRVRVTASLLNTRDGFQTWTGSYDRSTSDTILVQTQLARAVADALALQLTPAARERIVRAPLAQLSAYDLYLLGRHRQLQRNPAGLGQAITYYLAALAADPSFALAHAGLADAYLAGHRRGVRSRAETLQLAQAEVDAALRQDPELAEAHSARGLLLIEMAQPEEALRALDRALAIDSGASEAYLRRGLAHEHAGRPLAALSAYDQAAALDPLHTDLHVRRCLVLASLGRHEEAERSCQRGFELQPGIPDALQAHGVNAYARGDLVAAVGYYLGALKRAPDRSDFRRELASIYLDLGMHADGPAAPQRTQAGHEDATWSPVYGWWALARGNRNSATRVLLRASSSNVAPDERLEATALALAVGDVGLAVAVAAGVDSNSVRAPNDLRSAPYHGLWGPCELCTLALLQQRTGAVDAAARSAAAALVALDDLARRGYRWPALDYQRAGLLAQMRHKDAALDALERAVDLGWRRAWLARIDPTMDHLRREPRFAAALARIDALNAHARVQLRVVVNPQ